MIMTVPFTYLFLCSTEQERQLSILYNIHKYMDQFIFPFVCTLEKLLKALLVRFKAYVLELSKSNCIFFFSALQKERS